MKELEVTIGVLMEQFEAILEAHAPVQSYAYRSGRKSAQVASDYLLIELLRMFHYLDAMHKGIPAKPNLFEKHTANVLNG